MGKMVYKNGFNLLDAYPIKFSDTVETVKYTGDIIAFDFSLPEEKIENIVVNLCLTEPWALPNSMVLKDGTRDFLSKLENIRDKYFPESNVHVIISSGDTIIVEQSKQYIGQKGWLHVHTLEPIYPNDAPVVLLKKILGLDIAYGQNTIEAGVLLLEPQTIFGIYLHHMRKYKNGDDEEFNIRLIPISGTGLTENKVLKVLSGTPIQNLLNGNTRENIKYRVFVDGPLNGVEVEDLTQEIDWSTRNIVVLEEKDYKVPFPFIKINELLFTTSLIGELRNCVYCNYCDDICPVGLEPALFWHSHRRGEKHKARLYALEKCIECGLCSYICPSKLELFRVIKECKADIKI